MLKLEEVCDISIPVRFGKAQVSAFGAGRATEKAYKAGKFIGDTRRGGSCNCGVYTFSPHLHGTHTECIGHITKKRIAVPNVGLVEAELVTAQPKKGLIEGIKTKGAEALIVRTQARRKNTWKNWPTFTAETMAHIAARGVKHLLVDIPSVDAVDDDILRNHRIFWSKGVTITELVFIPARVEDGKYLLNLQVAAFDADAAPSRPVLYKMKK